MLNVLEMNWNLFLFVSSCHHLWQGNNLGIEKSYEYITYIQLIIENTKILCKTERGQNGVLT